MRKSLMVPVGLVSAAVLAVAGITAANAANAAPELRATAARATTAAGAATAISIGQPDAEQTALAAAPGSRVLESELQSHNGRPVWNVHLSTAQGFVEVKVDAQTGMVVLDDNDADAAATAQDDDQTDDHGGATTGDRGHRGGHGNDDPAGHH